MKKYLMAVIALIFSTTLVFAGGDQNRNTDALKVAQLDDTQKAIIYSVYEEEKVARDVYIRLGDLYPEENTFANIQLSEQTHMDAVRNLCVKYGIAIPVVDQDVGVFNLDPMGDLYEGFVSDVKSSLIDALDVGIRIEEMDIEDLTAARSGMPRDVQRVFDNLIIGSYNHLEAFTMAYERETAQ